MPPPQPSVWESGPTTPLVSWPFFLPWCLDLVAYIIVEWELGQKLLGPVELLI